MTTTSNEIYNKIMDTINESEDYADDIDTITKLVGKLHQIASAGEKKIKDVNLEVRYAYPYNPAETSHINDFWKWVVNEAEDGDEVALNRIDKVKKEEGVDLFKLCGYDDGACADDFR